MDMGYTSILEILISFVVEVILNIRILKIENDNR